MDEGKDYSLGHLRAKYLDMANISFTQGQYVEAEGHIKSFLDTIKDETQPAIDITNGFNEIMERKKEMYNQLNTYLKEQGELEKTDIKNQGSMEIEVEVLHDKKVICWNTAMKHGLLYE